MHEGQERGTGLTATEQVELVARNSALRLVQSAMVAALCLTAALLLYAASSSSRVIPRQISSVMSGCRSRDGWRLPAGWDLSA
jgi:hypothetical protein